MSDQYQIDRRQEARGKLKETDQQRSL